MIYSVDLSLRYAWLIGVLIIKHMKSLMDYPGYIYTYIVVQYIEYIYILVQYKYKGGLIILGFFLDQV